MKKVKRAVCLSLCAVMVLMATPVFAHTHKDKGDKGGNAIITPLNIIDHTTH